MSDLIRVSVPEMRGTMKPKPKKIRGGASMPCTHCTTAIVFESESREDAIRQALSQGPAFARQALTVN